MANTCPFCAEEILPAAKKCKHCGEWLGVPPPGRELALPAPARRSGGLRPMWAILILGLVAAVAWLGGHTFQARQDQELHNDENEAQALAATSLAKKAARKPASDAVANAVAGDAATGDDTSGNAATGEAASSTAPGPATLAGAPQAAPVPRAMTQAQFLRIEIGMSYEQVAQVLGWEGTETSRAAALGATTIIYTWQNSDGASLTATFQNGKLSAKSQVGLK